MTKRCSKCGEEKPLGAFSARTRTADGHRNDCIQCKKEYDAARYVTGGVAIRERVKQYSVKNAEALLQKRKALPKTASRRAENRKRLARWRKTHPEANELLRRLHKQTRRARAFAGGAPDPQHLLVLLRQPRCTYCDTLFDAGVLLLTMSVDHVLPLARGGTNHSSNLVAVCRRCNASKGDRILYLEWLPLGLVRDRVFTKEEVEVYCREEAEKQRALPT